MQPQVNASAQSAVGKNSLPSQIRILTTSEDSKFEGVLDRVESLLSSTLATGDKPAISLVCQIVRLQDHTRATDVCLPVGTSPCLLMREGRSYISNPELDEGDVRSLFTIMSSLISALGPEKLRCDTVAATEADSASNLAADFVVYVPHSQYHVRILISEWRPSYAHESTRFDYSKDGSRLWSVSMTERNVSMSLSAETLHLQFGRMKAGQTHGFTLLVRDFLRNATALAKALASREDSRKRKLFYPGVFDLAADVKQHYDTKVDRFVSQEDSEAGGIRKYNNLIKSILLNEFVPQNPVVLDLACGHGQDLMKYRTKNPRLFVGTDIAQAALNEAKRRHTASKLRYSATFMQGNLMLPDIFEEVKRAAESVGITEEAPFDVISIQLALHYIVGSKEDAKSFFERALGLLKSGGRFIATFPCCDRIARRLRGIVPTDATFSEFAFGNNSYRITFTAEELTKIAPSLHEAIESKSNDAFELAVEELDFDEVAQMVASTWGVKYKFWLVQTIDNQEEFIVPCSALEAILGELKAGQEMGGNFAEVINDYTRKDHPMIKDFMKRNIVLTNEEDEVFTFYRSVVIRKQ